ncbi:hypothetical protein BDZ89DRAFT_1058887 [Hymenopellis radicata]|nr:hypothetical protein BDZ89DRAFT_1058887 [Hymenopellis radicata]
MPKSAKKRKDKAADFSKAKLKLGKGKQLASNAIDTSFKARSIALPSQSITKDKDDEGPTTKRRLTFDELVAHTKHYAAGTRKDAILGFRELLESHPELLQPSLTTLFMACARLIGDEDSSVRKTLLSFFSWLLPRIPKEQLAPHAPSLLLFTTSAQTHIFPEIRVDAIRFLDLLLESAPESVVAGWNEGSNQSGKRVLEGYLGLLSAGTKYGDSEGPLKATSTASVVLTAASKLVVLKSLATFIRKALASTKSNDNPRWYLASSFDSPEAYSVFDNLLQPLSVNPPLSSRRWAEEYDDETGNEDFVFPNQTPASSSSAKGLYLNDLLDIPEVGGSTNNEIFIAHLARVLHSTLVSTFLDCSPVVFSPAGNPPETELQLALAVADISRALYGEILRSASHSKGKSHSPLDDLSTLLGHMAPFFPFTPSGRRDIKIEQAFQELNIIYCELSSLIASDIHSEGGSRDEAVRGYVLDALDAGKLTSAAYTSLLPTIWSLIRSGDVLDAVVTHAISLSAKSALKRPATEFLTRLILLERKHVSPSTLEIFVGELPKTLWELGSGNLDLSEIILRFLLRVLQRGTKGSKTVTSLRTRFMPYFVILHASRGSIPGPYTKLPPSSIVRRLALEVAATLVVPGDALSGAISSTLIGSTEGEYWASVSR